MRHIEPTLPITYLIIPMRRGTGDLDEECTFWEEPAEEQFNSSVISDPLLPVTGPVYLKDNLHTWKSSLLYILSAYTLWEAPEFNIWLLCPFSISLKLAFLLNPAIPFAHWWSRTGSTWHSFFIAKRITCLLIFPGHLETTSKPCYAGIIYLSRNSITASFSINTSPTELTVCDPTSQLL